jgi:hypothetical protein
MTLPQTLDLPEKAYFEAASLTKKKEVFKD